jgi:hypothetical protein
MHFFLQDAQLKVSILSIISFHDKGLATNYKEKNITMRSTMPGVRI